MIKALLFLIFMTVFNLQDVAASSCCGSGQATSSLILSEQKILLNTSFYRAESVGRIYESKDFFVFDEVKRRVNNRLSLSASYALDDKNQVGFSTFILFSKYQDQFGQQSDENLADVNLNFARKFKMQSFDSFLSFGLILPTGRSPYDAGVLSENANVSGFGQNGAQVGVTMNKVSYPYTLLADLKYSRFFSGEVNGKDLKDFDLLSASVFLGYSLNYFDLSVGGGVALNSLTRREVDGVKTGASSFSSINFVITKGLDEASSLALSYSDQTLIDGAKNSLLDRVVGLNFIHSIY